MVQGDQDQNDHCFGSFFTFQSIPRIKNKKIDMIVFNQLRYLNHGPSGDPPRLHGPTLGINPYESHPYGTNGVAPFSISFANKASPPFVF